MAHNVHNETVVPGSFARRQARALFSTLVLTLWVLGFTFFILYKYVYALLLFERRLSCANHMILLKSKSNKSNTLLMKSGAIVMIALLNLLS